MMKAFLLLRTLVERETFRQTNATLIVFAELAADDAPRIPCGRIRRNREAARGGCGHRLFTPRHNVRAE